ncbi:proline racemase family protein [Neobacillus sp. SuZ13]|uniref:proline racemase family protein n=1 Tax=Neobacillus sp. SuZ13 TaxID=3047875 RepID=UPI0024BFB02B|nr:proline racemase family protein [Neobacillus sp. SuZ13]WHY67483.1 proline racemase family protein [Neobacillus sp. SuZ13]
MNIQKAYTATDVHVAGEAFRIIKDAPFIHYQSLQELNEQFPHAYEIEIKLLLNEPRGFAGLNGCLVVPPFKSGADAAVVFFDHNGTVPMQYGGIVAVITALLECGQLKAKPSNEYSIETVSGIVTVTAVMEAEEVKLVKLKSEPCQVAQTHVALSYLDLQTEVTLVQADQQYAIFDKAELPFEIEMDNLTDINQWGQKAIKALEGKNKVDRVVLLDHSQKSEGKIKTVTFRPDCYIVRSPGFGTTAACSTYLLGNGDVSVYSPIENESIFNGKLTAELLSQIETDYEFRFSARGFITGMQTYVLDPTDPLSAGFLLK